jgi:hypothetical protein
MNAVLVRCLVWLLIAVLPLQGAAAAVRICCETTPSLPAAAHHAAHAEHHAALATANTDHDNHHKGAPCKLRAACCMGTVAVLSSAPQFMPPFNASSTGFLPPAPLITAYIPAGLERPPRSLRV